ncbi:unnamed protein product [Closterium sp. NIES-65]|nr:unnamed protein product [Closterium sp. NIES-65]
MEGIGLATASGSGVGTLRKGTVILSCPFLPCPHGTHGASAVRRSHAHYCTTPATAAAASLRVARAAGAAVRRGVRAAAASEGENGSLRTQPGQEQEAEARGEGGEADPVLEEARRRRAEWQAPAPTRVEEILDVLFVFGGLLDRPFGSGQSIAAAGRVVLARVEKEVQALRQEGEGGSAAAAAPVRTGAAAVPRSGMEGVAAEGAAAGGGGEGGKGGAVNRQQVLFELTRVVQLLGVDMQMVGAAVKEETLLKRLEEAKSHCQLAMRLANSL